MASQNLGLRERKKAQTRQRIIDVTLELIDERGYEKTTVDEIVRRVEISAPTFYSYFDSKDYVLRAVAGRELEAWAALVENELLRKRSTRQRLMYVYQEMAAALEAEPELWRALLRSNAIDPWGQPEQREADLRGKRMLERILAEGQKRGDVSKRFAAKSLAERLDTSQFLTCCAWAAEYPDPFSLEDALKEGIDFFLYGAQPRR